MIHTQDKELMIMFFLMLIIFAVLGLARFPIVEV